ncbi:acyl-CoA synthetase, partial [Burkholderia pseudomallei]
LLTDREFSRVISKALEMAGRDILVIDVEDETAPAGDNLGSLTYEQLLAEGDPAYEWQLPDDEWNAIALNYTSGTTGNPKG